MGWNFCSAVPPPPSNSEPVRQLSPCGEQLQKSRENAGGRTARVSRGFEGARTPPATAPPAREAGPRGAGPISTQRLSPGPLPLLPRATELKAAQRAERSGSALSGRRPHLSLSSNGAPSWVFRVPPLPPLPPTAGTQLPRPCPAGRSPGGGRGPHAGASGRRSGWLGSRRARCPGQPRSPVSNPEMGVRGRHARDPTFLFPCSSLGVGLLAAERGLRAVPGGPRRR